ncbi:MAG: alpha/beta fold hydrolase [Saprospiraceae bacterium]
MKKFIIAFFLLLFALLFGITWFFSTQVIYPEHRNYEDAAAMSFKRLGVRNDSLLNLFPAPTEFEVTSRVGDDVTLRGWHFAGVDSARCAFILVHGYNGNRIGMMKYAQVLRDCGCDLYAFDHRAMGLSGGTFGSGGILEKEDLISVDSFVQATRGISAGRIAWLGESWGGAAVLEAGAMPGAHPAMIIADSPFQDWETAISERALVWYGGWTAYLLPAVFSLADWRAGMDHTQASPLLAAPDITAPTLVIHSAADIETASGQAVAVGNALPPATSETHILDWGSYHAGNVVDRPEEYRQLILNFRDRFAPGFGGCE